MKTMMRLPIQFFALVFVSMLPFSACKEGKRMDSPAEKSEEMTEPLVAADEEMAVESKALYGSPGRTASVEVMNQAAGTSAPQFAPPSTSQPVADSTRRMLDRDGSLDIQVREYQPALDSVRALVKQWGGYVESLNETNSDSMRVRSAQLSVRIPSVRFEGAMNGLSGLGMYVNARSETVTDVTREYHDNLARLKTRKILEERYQNLLKQAKNVRDVMQIERELNNLRYEIEAAESVKRATEFEVRMSQISLTVSYEKRRSELVDRPSNGFFARVGRSLGRAFENVGDVFLWGIEVVPSVLAVLAIVALPVWWWRRKRRK